MISPCSSVTFSMKGIAAEVDQFILHKKRKTATHVEVTLMRNTNCNFLKLQKHWPRTVTSTRFLNRNGKPVLLNCSCNPLARFFFFFGETSLSFLLVNKSFISKYKSLHITRDVIQLETRARGKLCCLGQFICHSIPLTFYMDKRY